MFGTHNKARILSFSIEDAPMVETQFHRPLVAAQTNDVMIGNIAAHIQANNGEVNTAMLSNVVSGIALPSAAPEMINGQLMPANLAGGWTNQRLKFIMRVAIDVGLGNEVVECYVGYTDRKDITMQSNLLSDDMLFVINNGWTERVVRSTIGGGDRTIMANTTNVLSNANYESVFDNNVAGMITKIRPIDAFTMMSHAPAMQAGIVDATNIGLVSRNPTPSATDNNVISNYLGRVIDGYVNGVAQLASNTETREEPGFGGVNSSTNNLYSIAASYTPEVGLPSALRFTMMLGMNRFGSAIGSDNFTLKDLRMIDPHVVSKIDYFKNNHAFESQLMVPQNGFHNWAGAGANEQVAAQLSNIIPALMFRYGVNSVGGRITNRTLNNQTDCSLTRLILTVADVATTQFYSERFKMDLITEGVVPVTMLGTVQRDFDIHFAATMGNELEMLISLDGEYAPTPYRSPMFCNSLTAPVFGRDRAAATVFAHTLENIIQDAVLPVHRLTANLQAQAGGALGAAGIAPTQMAMGGGFDIGGGAAPAIVDLNNQPY